MKYLKELPEGYFNLAVAIIRQAAIDYRDEYNLMKVTGYKSEDMLELEDWFRNGCSYLSFACGEMIMQFIRKGVKITLGDDFIDENQGLDDCDDEWDEFDDHYEWDDDECDYEYESGDDDDLW